MGKPVFCQFGAVFLLYTACMRRVAEPIPLRSLDSSKFRFPHDRSAPPDARLSHRFRAAVFNFEIHVIDFRILSPKTLMERLQQVNVIKRLRDGTRIVSGTRNG